MAKLHSKTSLKTKFKGILLDLDGVVYIGDELIPGADKTISKLRESGCKLRFLTNTSTSTREQICDKLLSFGIDCYPSEVITPLQVAIAKIDKEGFKSFYPVLRENLIDEFKPIEVNEKDPSCIVIGDIGNKWNYDLMEKLFNFVMNGTELIALHKGKFFKTDRGLQIDIGVFITGLEFATGKKAFICGKPEKNFFGTAISGMDLLRDEIVMIGDDIDSDIGGAKSFGIKGYLVKTGKYNENFMNRSKISPDKIIESINSILN